MRASTLAQAVIILALAGCSRTVVVESEPPRPSAAATLGIPPGHLPPPGQCRIWVPGKPPGHQRGAGPCSALERQVPMGAWLVYRPAKDKKSVRVTVFDDKRPSVIVVVRYYEAETGKLLREEKSK